MIRIIRNSKVNDIFTIGTEQCLNGCTSVVHHTHKNKNQLTLRVFLRLNFRFFFFRFCFDPLSGKIYVYCIEQKATFIQSLLSVLREFFFFVRLHFH